jgi:GntR family transcriptional regulator
MQIEIDPLSTVPIYQQIRDRVVEAIASARLRRGDQLLSVRQLAIEFGINVATVSKAYEMLRNESLIVTNHKSGSLVSAPVSAEIPPGTFVRDWDTRLRTLVAEAVARGMSDSVILDHVADVVGGFAAQRAERETSTTPDPAANSQKEP